MKRLEDYKLVIWDLDGTLYYQKEFRRKMMTVFIKSLFSSPGILKEIAVILKYRDIREKWPVDNKEEDMVFRQYKKTAEIFRMKPMEVEKIITYWMHEKPLEYLPAFKDDKAADLINHLLKKGITTVVYSDYPTKEKLRALNIQVTDSFQASDPEISCLKPNPAGMEFIIKKYNVSKQHVIMIGDRLKKDGEAAKRAGTDWFILDKKRKKRARQYVHELRW